MTGSPTLLYQTPTADVLPAGELAISADETFPLTNTSMNVNYPEADAGVRFSPFRHLDFGLTAYTFTDYALDVKYKVLGEEPDRFGLAVGVYDIGLQSYVSSLGHGMANAWPDWRWPDRPAERFSAYAVTSIPLTRSFRLHAGLGRGRFVGYSTENRFLNTDVFFGRDVHHQWSVGLFGGVEWDVIPQLALVAEAGGRDLNSGVRARFGQLTAVVAWTKMEGLLFADEAGGTPKFGRVELGLSYQFNRGAGPASQSRREPGPPTIAVPPTPTPEPTGPAPKPLVLNLKPIYFDYDSWRITYQAADTLIFDAGKLLAHPDVKVVITGYASGEGTAEQSRLLAGRRAAAVFEYLKSIGVPEAQMRYRAMSAVQELPTPVRRMVTFEVDTGQ